MSHHAQTYYVAQAICKLTMYLRLGLNFWSSCFVLWNAGIKDMHHHAWFTWCWGWNQRFDPCSASTLPTEPDASPIQIVLNSSFASQGLPWRDFLHCKSKIPASPTEQTNRAPQRLVPLSVQYQEEYRRSTEQGTLHSWVSRALFFFFLVLAPRKLFLSGN